ncbi:hypothetical protein DL771_010008 [Monosporascus sp. 5C6A]|nr:hypothetical protein DL771_010008 [Monosporascus sp. 5C6A]
MTGILVRASTATLAAKVTSMIASITIERQGVPSGDVAAMSILRFTNAGPMSLAEFIFKGDAFGPPLQILTILTLLIAIASQFTSTLLVTDLSLTVVTAFPEFISNAYAVAIPSNADGSPSTSLPSGIQGFTSYWTRRPHSFEIFAEYAEPDAATEDDGVIDTGPNIRALLPISLQAEREMLQEFRGMTRVLDTRTTCVQPVISHLRFCPPTLTNGALSVCGTMSRQGFPDHVWSQYNRYDFECPLIDYTLPEYSWSLCYTGGGGIVTSLSNETFENIKMNIDGRSLLVWHAGDVSRQVPSGMGTTTLDDVEWIPLENRTSGPWLDQRSRYVGPDNEHFDIHFRASWCFEAFLEGPQFRIDYLNVTARSNHVHREPRYVWDQEQGLYNTMEVQHQLYSLPDNDGAENRDILTIGANDMKAQLADLTGKPLDLRRHVDLANLLKGKLTTTAGAIALSPLAAPDVSGLEISDAILSSMFHRTIQDTGSPAHALQAWRTTLARMVYYDYIGTFTAGNEDVAMVTKFREVLAPHARKGYWAVVAIIIANALLFLVVTCLFYRTQASFPDNAWHTIAQVSGSAELRDVLWFSRLATDDSISYWVRGVDAPQGAVETIIITAKDAASCISKTLKSCIPSKRATPQKRYVVRGGIVVQNTGRNND